MAVSDVLAFCPQPDYHRPGYLDPMERAVFEEWHKIPDDPADDIQADQCDSCGANDYRSVAVDDYLEVVCKECGQEYPTAWLPEHLVVF